MLGYVERAHSSGEVGHFIRAKKLIVPDFLATILDVLALDHEELASHHNGIDWRLTDVHGTVVRDTIA